jgi:hypothetical protein
MNTKKLNAAVIILSALFIIIFSSLAFAVLSDSTENLKT